MKKALVIVQFPYGRDQSDKQGRCNGLYEFAVEKSKDRQGIERLDANVWLIDVASELSFLAWLLQGLESIGISRRVAFLAEPVEWITA